MKQVNTGPQGARHLCRFNVKIEARSIRVNARLRAKDEAA